MKGSEFVETLQMKNEGADRITYHKLFKELDNKSVVSSDLLERLEVHRKTFPNHADYLEGKRFLDSCFADDVMRWEKKFDSLLEELKI